MVADSKGQGGISCSGRSSTWRLYSAVVSEANNAFTFTPTAFKCVSLHLHPGNTYIGAGNVGHLG